MATATAAFLARLRRLVKPGPVTASDADLLTRYARDRDEDAFAALVERHGPMVLRLAARLLTTSHDAEDAFQATFLILARRAASIRRRQSVAAWLHGVAYRVALKARAARGRRPEQAPVPDPVDPHPDPLAQVSARELLVALEQEVQRLPETYRLPVVLVCLEGLSQEEAARRLRCTPDSVRGRLARGRQRLHAQLVRRGLTLTAVLGAVELSRGVSAAAVPTLSSATVKAATVFAAGKGVTAGLVSANVVALTEGVLKAMFVKQSLVVSMTAVLLLGLVGAGTGQFLLGQAPGGASPGGENPPKAAGRAQGGEAAPGLPGKQAGGGDPDVGDLLRKHRDRILIEEQKLTQVVEAAMRKARATAPDDSEAALELLRRTLLQVWDHPDIGEQARNALLMRLLFEVRELRGTAAERGPQPPPAGLEAPFTWGEAHNGLRVGIAHEGQGREGGGARVALALENVGRDDLVVNLGLMLANGKKQFPAALRLILTDAKGGVRTLHRQPGFIAGRVDPFVVPLAAGCRYTLRYDIADFLDEDVAKIGMPWAPGRYRAAVEFVGKAVIRQATNLDTTGLALMNYWTGTVRSAELPLELGPQARGKEAPRGR
jgi:RNA polymerase sigma factor (sigma-70 family)